MLVRKLKGFLLFVVIVALIGAVAVLFVKMDRQTSFKTIGAESFEVATINATGVETEGNLTLKLRKNQSVDGLQIKVDEDCGYNYKLYFYDKDGNFISPATETLTGSTFEVPSNAKSFNIVIGQIATADKTPTELSPLNIYNIVSNFTITVSK